MGNHFVRCFPQPGKAKSRDILEAFAAGTSGARYDGIPSFFGVKGIEETWKLARASGRYYYLDNAYFDVTRGSHFRVGRNSLQDWSCPPDYSRLEKLGLVILPWRKSGAHIVVTMQSPHFMEEVAGWPGGANAWQAEVLTKIKKYTDRTIVVRHWNPDKPMLARTLREDLQGAWCLVTHSSAAANEAVLDGIPVFVLGQGSALPMGLSMLEQIEKPRMPDGREAWAATLAANQWTLDELRKGMPWAGAMS